MKKSLFRILFTLCSIQFFGGAIQAQTNFYSCPTVNTWTNDPADCGAAAVAAAGTPTNTDIAYVRDDWFNSVFAYSLPNLAWGMDGATFFSVKPKKLVLQNGGRVVFNTTSYTGLPAGFDLVTESGGTFASYTALAVINSITNNGAIHLYGSITNGNNIAGSGSICYGGNFENSTLGGSINGAFTSATEATLIAGFFTTVDAGLGGRCGAAAALPVELIGFEAVNDNGNVLLTWITGSELNSSHFEIERSFDGIEWEILDYVAAAGNSDFVSEYEYVDHHTLGDNRIAYYRLKMVDLDDRQAYSLIRSVKNSDFDFFDLYTTSDNVVVNIKDASGEFRILDMSGKEVYVTSVSENASLVLSQSQIGDAGIYAARFVTAGGVESILFCLK